MRKGSEQKIKMSKDKREDMINKIKKYFSKERGEELGDLGATMILDFIINELAVEFYNQGINDSFAYMNDKVDEMLGLQK